MVRLSFPLFLLLALGLSGCAISVAEDRLHNRCAAFMPIASTCNCPMFRVRARRPLWAALIRRPWPAASTISISRRRRSPVRRRWWAATILTLFLSGGSQEGAFGAGVLVEWNGRLGGAGMHSMRRSIRRMSRLEPNPIPAGSRTFGSSPDQHRCDPCDAAFINRVGLLIDHEPSAVGDAAVHNGYAIRRERELLRPLAGSVSGRFTLHSAISTVRHGAVADLRPLRDMLLRELGPDELEAVAQGHAANWLLLAGVVDVDTGQAVALDLTEMASRFAAARAHGDAVAANRFHNCYVNAVVASSSAPLAALPVFSSTKPDVCRWRRAVRPVFR